MLYDVVRINSGIEKKEVILTGNKPVGWCRSRPDNITGNLGATSLNIHGSIYRYCFMCFDLGTFPPVDSFSSAKLYVYGRKDSEKFGNKVRVCGYYKALPTWTNSTRFPEEKYNDGLIQYFSTYIEFESINYLWSFGYITDLIKFMKSMHYNTLVLCSGDGNATDDFHINFSAGNEPYLDFTLK